MKELFEDIIKIDESSKKLCNLTSNIKKYKEVEKGVKRGKKALKVLKYT